MSDHPISAWIMLVISLISAALGLAGWSFDKFETKEHAQERRDSIDKRLERIETKLDNLITRQR